MAPDNDHLEKRYDKMNYNYKILFVALAGLFCGMPRSQAQNAPKITEQQVPGTLSSVQPVPDNYSTFVVPPGLRYVHTIVPKKRDTTAAAFTMTTDPSLAAKAVQYLDGSGAVMQQVGLQTAKAANGQFVNHYSITDGRNLPSDVLSFPAFAHLTAYGHGYDKDGMFNSEYYHMPGSRYPQEGGTAENFKGLALSKLSNTSTANERSSTTYAPGKSRIGQNRGTKTMMVFNKTATGTPLGANEPVHNIRTWEAGTTGLPTSTATYADNTLKGSVTINEEGSHKWVFRNKEGQPVMEANLLDQKQIPSGGGGYTETFTYAYTYYVYDELGRLRFVLPPKAVAHARANGWTLNANIIRELCFEYQYDAKGRQHSVHKPGEQGFTELVYDNTGRTIMRRSPLEAQQGLWEVILYDKSNRIMITGTLASTLSRAGWQQNARTGAQATTAQQVGYYLWGAGKHSYPALGSITGFTEQSINYYDNYNFTSTQTPLATQAAFNAAPITPHLSTVANAEPFVQRASAFGLLTASNVRVLKRGGTVDSDIGSNWDYSRMYYDKEGRNIFTIKRNPTAGRDTIATQYDHTGKVLVSLKYANVVLGAQRKVRELTRYIYEDHSGRLLSLQHKVNNGPWKTLETNSYDEMGRLSMKTYGDNAESQVFSYNIRGELTGINEQYALNGNKQGRHMSFGEALRYDHGFTRPRYDGNAAGVVWRGSAATVSSTYAYEYDRGGRMLNANFYRATAPVGNVPPDNGWDNTWTNYSEAAQYDAEGNITSLDRKAPMPVGPPPFYLQQTAKSIDQLSYTYVANSNKLQKVEDANTANTYPWEYQRKTTNNYTYDHSGNLTADAAKGISSIEYTWFNKPAKVTFSNGNKIEYVYDAGGNKLREHIIQGGVTKVLTYIGNIVFEGNNFDYLHTPSGRTNMKTTLPTEEYFIRDRLGNIRSIVRDAETMSASSTGPEQQHYAAGYELPDADIEEQLFGKVAEVREDKPGSTQSFDSKAAKLEGQHAAMGTSIMLKVMAGDKIGTHTDNFYEQLQHAPEDVNGAQAALEQLLLSMTAGMSGLAGTEGGSGAALPQQGNPAISNAYEALQNAQRDSTRPRSFLNYLFFNEQLELVPEHSRLWQADGEAGWQKIGTEELEPIEAAENGYIVVYLSNESAEPVYFDNFSVITMPGVLLEERHYYAYGLPIGNWGTAAAGSLNNRQRYQGNEYREEAGLNWMDFHNRQYDPQLGRFLGIDPLADAGGQQVLSPYHAMGGNPAMMVDPLGLQAISPVSASVYYSGARPTRTDQLLLIPATLLLDAIYGFGVDPWMETNRALSRAFVAREAQIAEEEHLRYVAEKFAIIAGGLTSSPLESATEFVERLLRSNSGVAIAMGNDDYSPDLEKDEDGLTMFRFNLFKYSLEAAEKAWGNGTIKRGVKVKIVSQVDLSKYTDVDWIQSVFTSSSIDGRKKYEWSLDGKTKEEGGNPPFYWGSQWDDTRKDANRHYGGIYFSDFPGRNQYAGNYIWSGQLSLVGKINGRYENIMTINYGFSVINNIVTDIYGPYLGVPTSEQIQFINRANEKP